ncbi:MAG: hypothetical protein U1E37_11420 [Sphingomonadaceae bacterium]
MREKMTMAIGKSWKLTTGLAILVSLAGCDAILSPEIEDCEQQLLRELRAPATYNRIKSDTTVMDHLKPPEFWVSIKYDAANAFGTPIRGEKICRYALVEGRADLNRPIDVGAPLAGLDSPAKDIRSAPVGKDGSSIPDVPQPSEQPAPAAPVRPKLGSDENAGRDKPVAAAELCWEGYCPCDPPQGGPDQLLCDALRRGDADPKMLSVGKSMRETRRQIGEYQF